jgi:hypothetical protein
VPRLQGGGWATRVSRLVSEDDKGVEEWLCGQEPMVTSTLVAASVSCSAMASRARLPRSVHVLRPSQTPVLRFLCPGYPDTGPGGGILR